MGILVSNNSSLKKCELKNNKNTMSSFGRRVTDASTTYAGGLFPTTNQSEFL